MFDAAVLSKGQMHRLGPFFPRCRGLLRVDDRRVISRVIYVIRNGLQWKDARLDNAPSKTLHNAFIRRTAVGCSGVSSPPWRSTSARPGD